MAQIKICAFENALKNASKSIDLNTNWTKGYYFLGLIHFHLKNDQDSLKFLSIALSKEKDNKQILELIEKVKFKIDTRKNHSLKQSIIGTSENVLDKKMELEMMRKHAYENNDPNAMWKLAQDAIDRESFKEALIFYQKLIEIGPKDQNFYIYIIFCHIMLGNYQLATQFLDKLESKVWIIQLGNTLLQYKSQYAICFIETALNFPIQKTQQQNNQDLNYYFGFIGICYMLGNFVKQDFEKAKFYFKKASDCGLELEMINDIETFLQSNPSNEEIYKRIKENLDEELVLLKVLSTRGDINAMKSLIGHHIDDPESQIFELENLVEKGHFEYCEVLSKIYVNDGLYNKAKLVMDSHE